MRLTRAFLVLTLCYATSTLVSACARTTAAIPTPRNPDPVPTALPAEPWSGAPLNDVPSVFRQEWLKADNRTTCALVAPASLGDVPNAVPRAATFSGGWGVAYDIPGMRSAFGVAGTSVVFNSQTYDSWPHRITWAGGSTVGYGPEGGAGLNQLAYLRIAGQNCLYNIWSRLGKPHLEHLITALRTVR